MTDPQPHPPPEVPPPHPQAGTRGAGSGTASLVTAIVAPLSLFGTIPATGLLTVLAYYLGAPMHVYRWQPLIIFGLPVLVGLVSVVLALVSLKGAPSGSPGRTSAVAALCINSLVFVPGLIVIMPHLRPLLFG